MNRPDDERLLAEKLIGYDTSSAEGVQLCAGFVKGWLEARDIPGRQLEIEGKPILVAEVGEEGPVVVFHGHLDVVPAREHQFEPTVEGERLLGRGAYDMKGGLAAMMLAVHDLREVEGVRVRLAIVPDEEVEEVTYRATDLLVDEGLVGDFAITGEPTDMLVGIAAKGVLAVRLQVQGRAAHGSTPWEGDNAITKAVDVFRAIEALPFTRQSSDLFDRPSINLGRILGGDALNKVPDICAIDVDIRFLPEQDPDEILADIAAISADIEVVSTFTREPVLVDRDSTYVRALCDAAGRHHDGEMTSVGRDGASDAVSFLRAGVPAVEFCPIGGGHHGPDEWVSIPSLAQYRRALRDFVEGLDSNGEGSA